MRIADATRFTTPSGGSYQLADGWVRGKTEGDVADGRLVDLSGGREIPIAGGIPRFVGGENYAANFGVQWNEFRTTQLDSRNGTTLSRDRFFSGTGWKPEELAGKRVLEAGCGAGRFTEVILSCGANVVSFDYSRAVDACYQTLGHARELVLFQGDIYDLPLPPASFDFVFCYGVLQHTPDPAAALASLVGYLKPGGRIAVDSYIKDGRVNPSKSKYLWRPLTRRLPPERLLKALRAFMPVWLPVDTRLKRLPGPARHLGTLVGSLIPCWNYLDMGLTERQRLEWAIMDTFDALAAAHDHPQTPGTIERWLAGHDLVDIRVRRRGNGVEAVARKAAQPGDAE